MNRKKGNEDTLILVHALFRHGNRTTDKDSLCPSDPHLNESYFPYGNAELTNVGKRTMYELGKSLRKRYNKFLGEVYIPGLTFARTTNLNRTKASLQLVLASLFPPVGIQNWMDGMNWQPIPYSYEKPFLDKELLGHLQPNFRTLYDKFINTDEIQQDFQRSKGLFDYISQNARSQVLGYREVYVLYFGLVTEAEWGLTLPKWTKTVFPEPMQEYAIRHYECMVGCTMAKQLVSGQLIKKILEDSKAKINNTGHPEHTKLFLYSGHELNVACMLITLGLFNRKIPQYGCCVLFELHKINDVYGFKIFYQDSPECQPNLLKIPGCEDFCPLPKFETIYEQILPSPDVT